MPSVLKLGYGGIRVVTNTGDLGDNCLVIGLNDLPGPDVKLNISASIFSSTQVFVGPPVDDRWLHLSARVLVWRGIDAVLDPVTGVLNAEVRNLLEPSAQAQFLGNAQTYLEANVSALNHFHRDLTFVVPRGETLWIGTSRPTFPNAGPILDTAAAFMSLVVVPSSINQEGSEYRLR